LSPTGDTTGKQTSASRILKGCQTCGSDQQTSIPAYQLVLIYKLRWDIEKVFYQLKSKMAQRKSWARSEVAKRHHAIFDYLSHNLILLMELEMKHQGLIDEVKAKKRIGREKTRRNRAGEITKSAANP
jgi:transposase